MRQFVQESIYFRLVEPAIVMRVVPTLKIAVYSDEHDAIILIDVPNQVSQHYDIEVGQRLLALCSFVHGDGQTVAKDIFVGSRGRKTWSDVNVMIAEFLSDEMKRIQYLKNQFGEDEWTRIAKMANDYYRKFPSQGRNLIPSIMD
jgi:hypothetical protein